MTAEQTPRSSKSTEIINRPSKGPYRECDSIAVSTVNVPHVHANLKLSVSFNI